MELVGPPWLIKLVVPDLFSDEALRLWVKGVCVHDANAVPVPVGLLLLLLVEHPRECVCKKQLSCIHRLFAEL